MPQFYEIRFKGRLECAWSGWFAGLDVAQTDEDITVLTGSLPDQPALFGLLERIRDLNLTLLSVTLLPPDERNPK